MLRKAIVLAGVALMVTAVAAAQIPRREYSDLRPELAKEKFTEGKHLIKTLPDGQKVSLGFKSGKIVGIYLTDKAGKEHKGVLAEAKVSHRPVSPEMRSLSIHAKGTLILDFCSDDSVCRSIHSFVIHDQTTNEDVVIEIDTCCY